MFVPSIAAFCAADDPAEPVTPTVTCIDNLIRVAEGSDTFAFDPTQNDFTNDGASIALVSFDLPDDSKGTLDQFPDSNALLYTRADGYAGTFSTTYQVESSTGATGTGTITFIVEGETTQPSCIGLPDTLSMDTSTSEKLFDVLANDTGTGPMEITPGSLTQPTPAGPTISIDATTGKLKVTRNSATARTYTGSYIPRLKDGSATGLATQVSIVITAATVTAPDFEVSISTSAAQPFKIDALARASGTGPIELTPAGLTQPNGSQDSAVITGSGATGYIDYTRSTTPVGEYTMKYKVRLIGNTAVEAQGTITIKITSLYWVRTPIAGGREWWCGPGYHDNDTTLWTSNCGARGAWTSQTMSATSRSSWAKTWGGPHNESIDSLTNVKDGQTDLSKPVWQVMKTHAPGNAYIVLVAEYIPDGYFGKYVNGKWVWDETDVRLYDYIDDNKNGEPQAGYERYGHRLALNVKAQGYTDPDMVWFRGSHEMNQTNTYRVWNSTRARFRASTEKMHKWMRTGWARVFPNSRLRFIFSPGRTSNIGDFQSWIPQSSEGGVDALTISFHPAQQVTDYKTFDQFLDRWDNSSYGILRDLEPACEALGLPEAEPEWSPRFEYRKDASGKVTKQPCTVANLVVQQYTKYLRKKFKEKKLIFETPFDNKQFSKTAYEGPDAAGKANWSAMVDDMKFIYRGNPKDGGPHKLDTPNVEFSENGTGRDYDAIAQCTGSDSVRISRIVSQPASGATKASITGTGANAKVRFARNGDAVGTSRKVVVEMTLAGGNYLSDMEITAKWT